jgi:uncharacterized membrane protein YccC
MRIQWGQAERKNAALTALATSFCYWITLALHLQAGYWAVISCVVVMQSEVGATLLASRDRVLGTAIGALTAWFALLAWHGQSSTIEVLVLGATVCVAIAVCNLLDLQAAGRLAGVTVVIVFLLHGAQPAWRAALSRFFEVSLGVLVALGTTAVFYPRALLSASVQIARDNQRQ